MVISRMRCHGSRHRSSSCCTWADLAALRIKTDGGRDTATAHRLLIFYTSNFLITLDPKAAFGKREKKKNIKLKILAMVPYVAKQQ